MVVMKVTNFLVIFIDDSSDSLENEIIRLTSILFVSITMNYILYVLKNVVN